MPDRNRRITFARSPQGLPVPDDFGADETAIPTPGPGQFLSRTVYLSLDPYYRNVMKNSQIYADRLVPGNVMVGETLAEVMDSRNPDFHAGEYVAVRNGWQQYALSRARSCEDVSRGAGLDRARLSHARHTGWRQNRASRRAASRRLSRLGVPRAGRQHRSQVEPHVRARIGIAGSPETCDFAVPVSRFDACVNSRPVTCCPTECRARASTSIRQLAGDTLVRCSALSRWAHGHLWACRGLQQGHAARRPLALPGGRRARIMKGLVARHLGMVENHDGRRLDPRGQVQIRKPSGPRLEAPPSVLRLMRGGNFEGAGARRARRA